MAETRTPIISFKNFSFQYRAQKQPTLHGINLDIYPGERVLIAGPSGSGKSTLAACINGLNPFSYPGECTGTLTVDGVDAPHSSIFELAGHVGTVLQDPDGQFIGLTVGEDIAFALENSCTPQDEMHEITRRAAELVGIENHLDYAPHELSGGQKQRVSLAGVMVDEVKILLFDEPLANLDPATGKQAIELIDTIQQKTDTTVLIIEHRLEDVLWRSVDRIVLVNEGRILADLRPDELLSGALLAENGIREPLYVTAMRYAGIDITPAKHPAHVDSVVLDDADLDKTIPWAVFGRHWNGGQVCVSSKRMIVVDAVYDEFIKRYTEGVAALVPGDPFDAATTLAPLSSQKAADDIVAQIARAVENGATATQVGDAVPTQGAFVQPTLLTGLTEDNPAFYEEFFGPVSLIFHAKDEDDAVRIANDSHFGLGGSVFTTDIERGKAVAARIDTGMVFVNHPTLVKADVPFGGVKRSGYGRELTDLGLNEFVNHKVIGVVDIDAEF